MKTPQRTRRLTALRRSLTATSNFSASFSRCLSTNTFTSLSRRRNMKVSPGTEGMKEAQTMFRAIDGLRELLTNHDMLTGSLEAELKNLRDQLTDFLCPYSAEELDKQVRELDEKFPDWEHGYTRCGATVTWHDRPKSPEHPLWHSYSH